MTGIGRRGDNSIVLDDPKVSRYHATIIDTGANFVINDLRSGNGVEVAHERIRAARRSATVMSSALPATDSRSKLHLPSHLPPILSSWPLPVSRRVGGGDLT